MSEKPPFNPNQPYQAVEKPAFDPSQPYETVSVGEDMLKSAGSGAIKGVTGLAGQMGDMGHRLGNLRDKYLTNPIARAIGAEPVDLDRPDPALKIGSQAIRDAIKPVTGDLYEPKTVSGQYAQTAGEFLPAMIGGPESIASKLLTRVAIPAAASETAGQITKDTAAEPWARIAGAFAGGMIPHVAGRAVTPLPSEPARQRLVDVLHDEGVTSLTAGQRTGNKPLQYLESAASNAPGAGGGAERIQQEGQRQFTEATMRRAGAGPDATPEVLAQNNQRLGQEFRDLSARNNLVPDNQFVNDVVAAARNYRRVPDSQQRQMVQGYIDDIIEHVNNGHMPGPQYQEMRSRLSRQANTLRQADPTLSEALRDMRNALDNGMGRSISPADQEAWQTARREYSAQKVIEKAASRAGEATAEGQIVPASLRNTVAAENRGAYARGEGPFSELSRAGSAVMAPLPNSGTAQRLNAFNLLNQATLGVVPAVTGRAVMSRPVQAYLANQALTAALRAPVARRRAVYLSTLEALRQLEPPVTDSQR